MSTTPIRVTSAQQLRDALQQAHPVIAVHGVLQDLPALLLPAGSTLQGSNGAALHFQKGQPGIQLAPDTRLENLRIEVDEAITAISLSDDSANLGHIHLHDITTVGRVHLEATQALHGSIHLRNIHVERADARMAAHRPAGFGVEVLLGAIAVYNFSKNPHSVWQLKAENLSCGSPQHPVRGSGVYVFGGNYIPPQADPATTPAATQSGGQVHVELLSTGNIHSDGGIPAGVPNLITGGVFLGSGAHAKHIQNLGSVTTYGVNDMVLDNWGVCDLWEAHAAITSRNTSGIGFVNFGDLQELRVMAPIETHGIGARGFNLYDGKLGSATFHSITTHGNGAIGIQLSKPFGHIKVLHDIRTTGGEGESLVRGKIVDLKAHALSLKPGVQGQSLIVQGKAITENTAIPAYEFSAPPSSITQLLVDGKAL